MLFMVMHKHDKSTEMGRPPPPDFVGKMGALIGDLIKSGAMKDGAGLGKSANRTRVTVKNGAVTTKDGPYVGDNELIASCFAIKAKNRGEAVEWATKLGRILGDGEIEVGKTTEAWDLGLAPEPPNPPFNALLLQKATKDSEAGKPVAADKRAQIEALKSEMKKAGVLTSSIALQPSAKATRVSMDRAGKKNVVDGPFTESKELIGGFALLDMPSKQAVLEFVDRYGKLLLESVETLEIDVRPLADE